MSCYAVRVPADNFRTSYQSRLSWKSRQT